MSDVLTILACIIPAPYLAVITTVIAVAALISAACPPPKSPVLAAFMKLVNLLALNVANARNTPRGPTPPA